MSSAVAANPASGRPNLRQSHQRRVLLQRSADRPWSLPGPGLCSAAFRPAARVAIPEAFLARRIGLVDLLAQDEESAQRPGGPLGYVLGRVLDVGFGFCHGEVGFLPRAPAAVPDNSSARRVCRVSVLRQYRSFGVARIFFFGPLDRMSAGRAVSHLNREVVFDAPVTIGAAWCLSLRGSFRSHRFPSVSDSNRNRRPIVQTEMRSTMLRVTRRAQRS